MIPLIDSLEIRNQKQNVARDGFITISEMKQYSEKYLPYVFISVCYEDKNLYIFCKDNEFDNKTGKWRAFATSQQIDSVINELSNRLTTLSSHVDESDDNLNNLIIQLNKVVEGNYNELKKITDDLNINLGKQIQDEKTRAETKEGELNTKIETTSSSLSDLSSRLDSEVDDLYDYIDEVSDSCESTAIELENLIESEAELRSTKDTELEGKITQVNTEIGDIDKVKSLSLTDVSTAIQTLYYSFMDSMTYLNKKLTITFRNGQTFDIDLSPIITDTNIEELKDVESDIMPTDNQILAYDSSSKKYTPKTFDLAKVLSDAKAYTDDVAEKMVKGDAIACDEEPVYDNGIVTYKIHGETKTIDVTDIDVWFFYTVESIVYEVIFIDGVKFKVANDGSFDPAEFVKNSQITDTYDEHGDVSLIPNLGVLVQLHGLIKTALGTKVNTQDVVDNLVSESSDLVLSANQGRVLKSLIDTITEALPTKMNKGNPTGTGSFSMNRFPNTEIGDMSTTLGKENEASGAESIATGFNTKALGVASHAEGVLTQSKGLRSHAEGYLTIAEGQDSHSEGMNTQASGGQSHAEGSDTKALSKGSHSEGQNTEASGVSAHAEGTYTNATGACAHSEGSFTNATQDCAHAEGNTTTASQRYSHAEGSHTEALSLASHAEGLYTKTIEGTNWNAVGQHVAGKYNIPVQGARITGAGSSETERSNIEYLDWEGNLHIKGKLYQNANDDGSGGESPDGKVKTVDNVQPDESGNIQLGVTAISEQVETLSSSVSELSSSVSELSSSVSGLEQSKVPVTRTINNKPLSEDVTLTLEDLGGSPTLRIPTTPPENPQVGDIWLTV